MRFFSKRRKKKAVAKRKAKTDWFKKYGELYMLDDTQDYVHICQSCGRQLALSCADFSHKVPAGRGGNEDPENGIASCRGCHTWLERGPDHVEARAFIIQSKINLTKDETIRWPPKLLESLWKWIAEKNL